MASARSPADSWSVCLSLSTGDAAVDKLRGGRRHEASSHHPRHPGGARPRHATAAAVTGRRNRPTLEAPREGGLALPEERAVGDCSVTGGGSRHLSLQPPLLLQSGSHNAIKLICRLFFSPPLPLSCSAMQSRCGTYPSGGAIPEESHFELFCPVVIVSCALSAFRAGSRHLNRTSLVYRHQRRDH